MYPSHLGATRLNLRISPSYQAVPDESSTLRHWAAPFHGPFHSTFLPTLIPDSTPLEPSWIPELEVVERLDKGHLWQVFTVRLRWLRSSDPDVVAKVSNLSRFPIENAMKDVFSYDDAVAAIVTELGLFSGALHDLQGSIVPRFRGLLGSAQPDGTRQWCALFDNAGKELSVEDRQNAAVR